MKLVSVIVPVYNVGRYLDKCVNSIVTQTYNQLEIILVDDGSTDDCPQICDDWEKKDKRIKVIHKVNGGLSDARNNGIKAATGKYVCFIDSDDWIEPDYVKTLIAVCTETGADIVECDWDKVSDEEMLSRHDATEINVTLFSAEEALEYNISDRLFKQTVVNKLYRKELVQDELFPVGKTNEDEFWTYRILGKAQKLAHIDCILYHYYQRQGSIINSSYSLKRLDGVEAKKNRMDYVRENFPALDEMATLSYINVCKFAYQLLCANDDLDTDKTIRKRLHYEFKKYFAMPDVSLKEKIWYGMFYLMPTITSMVRNRLKIGL